MNSEVFIDLARFVSELNQRMIHGVHVVGGSLPCGLIQVEADDAAYRRHQRLLVAANRGMAEFLRNRKPA